MTLHCDDHTYLLVSNNHHSHPISFMLLNTFNTHSYLWLPAIHDIPKKNKKSVTADEHSEVGSYYMI